MKKYLVFAAAASLFAACSNDDGAVAGPQQEAQQTAGEVAVGFDAYVNRATTRAGLTGDITPTTLQTSGFGVFAYHTNADLYDQTFVPNFMYNQKVTYKAGSGTTDPGTWEYTPIKYWPNEFGQNALSEDVDKVSFFAYAPYVTVDAASGKVNGTQTDPSAATYTGDDGDKTYGIVGMKSNSATGDPMVKYMASFYTNKQVDLTWGTVDKGSSTGTTISWNKKNGTSATQELVIGKPWLDVEHPSATSTSWATAQKVKFDFKHALARLNVTVDTKTNATTAVDNTTAPDAQTRVFIRSVTFEGFDMKGALNLNNATANQALWYNFDCLSELNNGSEVTIKDGRTDGKEGVTAAAKEFVGINPQFIQDGIWSDLTGTDDNKKKSGVIGKALNLFCKSDKTKATNETDAIYVIPNNDPLKVTIEYDVLTKDDNLVGKLNDGTTKGSVVKNVITRYITTTQTGQQGSVTEPTSAFKLENGKQYTIKLHIGLNSVEFDAAVTAWDAAVIGEADLPHNN